MFTIAVDIFIQVFLYSARHIFQKPHVPMFCFFCRKLLLQGIRIRMKGWTLRSFQSIWKNMRKNSDWPLRVWTKMKMVRLKYSVCFAHLLLTINHSWDYLFHNFQYALKNYRYNTITFCNAAHCTRAWYTVKHFDWT